VLHLVQQPLGGPEPGDRGQSGVRGVHGEPQQGDRVDDDVDAEVLQRLGVQQLALAEFGHVGQDRHVDRGAEPLEVGFAGHGLGEDQVGSGVGEGLRPVDRVADAVHRRGVGAGGDDEGRVAARGDRGLDPPDRGFAVRHVLAVQVPAALGVDLVLDVQPGHPRVLEDRHRAGRVHRLAEPGVRVHERWQAGDPRDLLRPPGHLGERGQPDVGQPEVGGDHRPRHVDALEPVAGDQHRRQRAERAGEPEQLP
jgi:hypothetical protein